MNITSTPESNNSHSFPCAMLYRKTGGIVLFTNSYTGTIIKAAPTWSWDLAAHALSWDLATQHDYWKDFNDPTIWTPYHGTITFENDSSGFTVTLANGNKEIFKTYAEAVGNAIRKLKEQGEDVVLVNSEDSEDSDKTIISDTIDTVLATIEQAPPFPRLRQWKNSTQVVLFSNDTCGVVLTNTAGLLSQGAYRTGWNPNEFRDFAGKITIKF